MTPNAKRPGSRSPVASTLQVARNDIAHRSGVVADATTCVIACSPASCSPSACRQADDLLDGPELAAMFASRFGLPPELADAFEVRRDAAGAWYVRPAA